MIMQNTQTASGSEQPESQSKSFTRFFPVLARLLLGLGFFVFGLNGFLNFIPQPKDPMPEGAAAFAGALMNTHYMFQLVAGTQLLVGVLLLMNRFVPLALALIAPIIVGIMTFHIFLAPATIGPGIVVLVLELYLAWAYRNAFRPMLAMRVKPNQA
ncbi:MAG: DoxX family protein [Verrucomicrobiota bacterium]